MDALEDETSEKIVEDVPNIECSFIWRFMAYTKFINLCSFERMPNVLIGVDDLQETTYNSQ